MRNTNVLILTDDAEFAKLLTACWQVERQLPGICVVTSEFWKDADTSSQDLIVIGPLTDGKLSDVLRSMEPNTALILCAPSEASELGSLRRTEALKLARQAERHAAQYANQAMLGRYMHDMKHNVNNALTSLLGNAELLLLEPGGLSAQSLAQIKTIHTMALRINEIMQRFSSLASELREDETPSQLETEEANTGPFPRR